MVKFEISTHINRPVADVFKYMADPAKMPEWNNVVEEATPSETPVKVGTKIQTRARFLGRKIETTAVVTEHDLNKRYTTKSEKPFQLTISTTTEPEAGGTKAVAVFEGEPAGFFKIGEPILARISKKQFQTQLDTAKELLEAQVPAER
jgi:uncharacterized protein YndB with AHSA1/START domain